MKRLFSSVLLALTPAVSAEPIVIAHRGASGYLPEHTLAGVAMAHAMGADFIEQDVVLTRDGALIVLHDLTLDNTTDVARQFPGRARDDGHYYAIDFTLEEIQRLRAGERRKQDGGPAFEGRFPVNAGLFGVPTLEEEIQLIQGLNATTGRDVGLFVELKSPEFHREAGVDLAAAVLSVMEANGYRGREDKAYLQSFDVATVKWLSEHTGLRVVQLVRDDRLTPRRARDIAAYANGVGPWVGHLGEAPKFAAWAREAGLEIHPYTFRADHLPEGVADFDSLLDRYVRTLRVSGLITDHPDLAVRYLRGAGYRKSGK